MRVCPVCNETFPDEMKFCDLDGAKLHRDGESIAQSQGKLWSLLGVGVVLGSLVIIGLAIFFSPRTPAPISSYTPPTPPSAESKPSTSDAASSTQPEVFEEEAPVAELKKKEKPIDSANSNTSSSPLNPKAAAQEAESKSDTQPILTEVKEAAQPEPRKIEPVESPKTVKAAAESESKASQPSAEPKRETKSSKDSDKASGDKKQNDDKKKGGFLKVFRKIFGGKKDEKEKKN